MNDIREGTVTGQYLSLSKGPEMIAAIILIQIVALHHREDKVDDRKLAMAVLHLLNSAVNDAVGSGAVIDGDTLPAAIEDLTRAGA